MASTQSRSLITRLQSPFLMVPAFPPCIPAVQDGAEHHHWSSKVEQSRGFNAEFHKNTASTWQHILIICMWEGLEQSDFPQKHISPLVHHIFQGSEGSGELWEAAGWSWLQHPKGSVLPHCLPSTLGLSKHITPSPNLSLGLTNT